MEYNTTFSQYILYILLVISLVCLCILIFCFVFHQYYCLRWFAVNSSVSSSNDSNYFHINIPISQDDNTANTDEDVHLLSQRYPLSTVFEDFGLKNVEMSIIENLFHEDGLTAFLHLTHQKYRKIAIYINKEKKTFHWQKASRISKQHTLQLHDVKSIEWGKHYIDCENAINDRCFSIVTKFNSTIDLEMSSIDERDAIASYFQNFLDLRES